MPSDRILKLKNKKVSEIVNKIESANAIVFVDYRGLTVEELSELRKKLRASDSDFKIYKNSLTKRALDNLKIEIEDIYLKGPNALTFSRDSVEPIKILSDFAKKHQALELRVGIVDGMITDHNSLQEIANLPSKEELMTMLAGGMIGLVKKMSICLNLIAEKNK